MSTNLQRILVAVILIIGYMSLSAFGEGGSMVHDLLGNFAVGWLVWEIAAGIVKDQKVLDKTKNRQYNMFCYVKLNN